MGYTYWLDLPWILNKLNVKEGLFATESRARYKEGRASVWAEVVVESPQGTFRGRFGRKVFNEEDHAEIAKHRGKLSKMVKAMLTLRGMEEVEYRELTQDTV